MNPKHFHTPVSTRLRCPVCHQPVYSRGGIHPQCAMRQSEPPMPKIDKAKVTLPGADGVVAVIVDAIPVFCPARSIRSTSSNRSMSDVSTPPAGRAPSQGGKGKARRCHRAIVHDTQSPLAQPAASWLFCTKSAPQHRWPSPRRRRGLAPPEVYSRLPTSRIGLRSFIE